MEYKASIKNGKININGLRGLLKRFDGKSVVLTVETLPQRRTSAQNRALHLWYSQLADKLNESGFDMKKIIHVDIPWSGDTVKQYLWKPLQKMILGTTSTRSLKRDDLDKVFDPLNKTIAERTEGNIHVPFPCEEELIREMEEAIDNMK